MRPAEYEIMFRVEETHWWYRALHRLIFENLERELPGWREKVILDAVICSSVLYHQWVEDIISVVRELRRVLRPSGLCS